jgi:thioredoxin-like negative regulator of GroEL
MSLRIKLFSSPTCAPCKTIKPLLSGWAKTQGFEWEIVDVDQYENYAYSQGVQGLPSVGIYLDGNLTELLGPAKATPARLGGYLRPYLKTKKE